MTPRAVRRRFVLISALTWLPAGLGLPVLVLLIQVRGVDLAGVGMVFAVYGITVAALELPTGGLADVMGRRTVLAASATVNLMAMGWLAFATSLWQFVAAGVLQGVARALSSGPAEAWYVDAEHTVRASTAQLRRGLAQGKAAGAAALAVGTLAGGGLPLLVPLPEDGLLVPLSVPLLLAAVAAATMAGVALFGLPEPARAAHPRFIEVVRDVPARIRRGTLLGIRDGVLGRVLLTAAALGVALNGIELLTPGRLADLTGDEESGSTAYALVAALGFAAVSGGSALGPWVARLLGGGRGAPAGTAAVGVAVAAVALGGLAASGGVAGPAGIVAAALAYAGMFTGLGIAGPVRSELLHGRVAATERATVLSVDSLLLQFGGTVGAVGLGRLAAEWSVSAAWWVAAAVLLAGGLLVLSRSVRDAGPSADHPVGAGVEVHPAGAQETDKAHT